MRIYLHSLGGFLFPFLTLAKNADETPNVFAISYRSSLLSILSFLQNLPKLLIIVLHLRPFLYRILILTYKG